MMLPNHFFVLLMSVPILVDSLLTSSNEEKRRREEENANSHSSKENVPGIEGNSNVEAKEQRRAGIGNCTNREKDCQDTLEAASCADGKRHGVCPLIGREKCKKTCGFCLLPGKDQDTMFPDECDFEVENSPSTQTPSTNITKPVPTRHPRCLDLPDPGECRGAFPRFYYNKNIDQCDCFLFGGCDEELVQFTWLTLQECLDACVPGNTTRTARCERLIKGEEIQTFFPNPETNESNDRRISTSTQTPSTNITKLVNESNDGRHSTSTQTPSTNITKPVPTRQPGCTVRPDPGECRGAFPRFYYDEHIDQCDCFLYGGCDEELVQFTWLTFQGCLDACVPGNTTKGARCERLIIDDFQTFFPSPTEKPVNNFFSRNEDFNPRVNAP